MDGKMIFSVGEAQKYANKGLLEEWVHEFLMTAGKNPEFSEGLKLQKRYWTGPLEMDLDRIERCCGPEESMEYRVDAGCFRSYVDEMAKSLNKGWESPPLLVQYVGGRLSVRDGNHRYEALKKCGIKRYWVILWFADLDDYKQGVVYFKNEFGIDIKDNKEEFLHE